MKKNTIIVTALVVLGILGLIWFAQSTDSNQTASKTVTKSSASLVVETSQYDFGLLTSTGEMSLQNSQLPTPVMSLLLSPTGPLAAPVPAPRLQRSDLICIPACLNQ